MKGLHSGVRMVLISWDRDQPGAAARAQALGVAEAISRRGQYFRVAEAATSNKAILFDEK